MFSGRVVSATLLLSIQGQVGIPFIACARYNAQSDRHVACLFGGDVGEGMES